MDFQGGALVRDPSAILETQETLVRSLDRQDSKGKEVVTGSSILPGEFLGQSSLVDYSPWGCKELNTTEHACMHLSLCEGITEKHILLLY